jgi:hypothetical protein
MEEDHPRKGEGRQGDRPSVFRKPPPVWIAALRSIALTIIVALPCAFLVGIGARMVYELFQVGWNLFGY